MKTLYCYLIVISLILTSVAFANDSVCDQVELSLEERVESLERYKLLQLDRNGELDEKIEELARKFKYFWRRQIARGTWIKRQEDKEEDRR